MSSTKKDSKLETPKEAKELGLKRISSASRPQVPRGMTLKNCKSRITIFLDADVVEHFKQLAENSGKGYQTLINQALRDFIEKDDGKFSEVKKELLTDKTFLENLKTVLAV